MSRSELDAWISQALEGSHRGIGRLLTLIDDGDDEAIRAILAATRHRIGRARVIGVTGPPGVGKSTLVSAISAQLRGRGRTVAIIAVDPSSPLTGGALLGDRVRMQHHHADHGVFIRSMAARGHLGGCSVATPLAVMLLDAVGFDDVIIETVGVGQSEVDVASSADTTIVVLAPGAGDSIQIAKAGLLEVADIFVVNKAEHNDADRLCSELDAATRVDGTGRGVPVLRAVAVEARGAAEIVAAVDEHTQQLVDDGGLHQRRQRRAGRAISELALELVRRQLATVDVEAARTQLAAQVADGHIDVQQAATQMVNVALGSWGASQ